MVRYYNSGYYLDGEPVCHTEESCPGARRVRAIQPDERTVQNDMELCPACRSIGEARQSKRRYYNQ
jgi:hypothetical protein